MGWDGMGLGGMGWDWTGWVVKVVPVVWNRLRSDAYRWGGVESRRSKRGLECGRCEWKRRLTILASRRSGNATQMIG